MHYKLYIDTGKKEAITVRLEDEVGKSIDYQGQSVNLKSQSLLPAIQSLMNTHAIAWNDISEIFVATGPGSFTGLRVGAAVGATISWLLSIPVNSLSPGMMPALEYGEDKWKLA